MYDASLGRWFNLDPLTEKYATKSPFHFSGNNPMKFVDLNGMSYKYNWDDGRYYNDEGIETSWDEVLAWIQRPENQGIIYGNEEYYASWGSYPHRSNSMTAFAFGRSWKKGEGGYYYLYPGDYFADQLLIHSSVLAAYEDVIKQIALGETTGRYSYSVGGMKTLKILPIDAITVFVGLTTGEEIGNPAATYFGSYPIAWNVISYSEETRTAIVQFSAVNTMSVGSAARPPLIGHTSLWQKYVEPSIRQIGDQYFAPQTIEIIWTRTLNF